MAGVNVTAAGWPDILVCRIFQKSTAEPGDVVLETEYTVDHVPKDAVLTVTVDRIVDDQGTIETYTGTWTLRVVQKPRIHKDVVHWVLHDDRYKLEEVTLAANYNARDELGRLDTANQKTITQLWALLAAESGLSITVGTVPSFKPPAQWAGKTGREAAAQALEDTACRMIYDPTVPTYRIESAGSGDLPNLDERSYSPGPPQGILNLHVDSGPILYESDVNAEPVLRDTSGSMVALSTLVTDTDLFNGFKATGALEDRARYQQSAFRLWRVTSVSLPGGTAIDDVVLLDKRATAIAQSPDLILSPGAHAYEAGHATFPEFQFIVQSDAKGDDTLTLLPGSKIYHANSPILFVTSGGAITHNIRIITGYHVKDGADLKRERVTTAISQGDDCTVIVPWLRPMQSSLADKETAAEQWTSLHSLVAAALVTKFSAKPETASIATMITHPHSGQIGAALYEFRTGWRGDVRTTWAFNFVPANWRNLRG